MSRAGTGFRFSTFYKSIPICLLFGLFVLSLPAAHSEAATSSSSITCLTAESASPVTITLTAIGNVTVSPTTIDCDGTPATVSITLTGSGTGLGNGSVTAATPAPTSVYSRDIFNGAVQTEDIAKCTSAGCTFATTQISVYSQVEVYFSYKIFGGGSGYTAPSLSYYFEGAPDSSPVSTASGAIWIDCCSSQWMVPSTLPGSTGTEQWATNNGLGIITSESAGSSVAITYYNQYSLTASFSVTSGSGYQLPQLKYFQYGDSLTASVSTAPASYWVDAGTLWSMSDILYGQSSSERWNAPFTTTLSGTLSEAVTVSPSYYNQYLINASYAILGSGSSGYSNPKLYYTSLGSSNSTTLTISPIQYWMDADSQWNVSNWLGGNSSLQRWQTDLPTSGSISSAENITVEYYWQYYVTFHYSVVGGGINYILPSLNYSQFGTVQTGSQGLQAWADVGSISSYTNPLQGSTSMERWFANVPTPKITSNNVNVTYYHQFAYLTNYTVEDGGQGYTSPILDYTTFGISNRTFLSTAVTVYWLDTNTPWNTTSLLPGSSATERWATLQPVQGISSAPETMDLQYFNQYALTLNYTIALGGSPPSPAFNYTTFAMSNFTQLNKAPTLYWVDGGSAWSITKSLQLSSSVSSERWITNMTTNEQSVSGVIDENFVYDHQYYLLVQLNDAQGGSSNGATGWYNAGNNISIIANAAGGWKFILWNGTGSASYTGPQINSVVFLTSPANETAIFYASLVISSGPNGFVNYNYSNQSGTQSGVIQPDSNSTIFVLPYTEVNLTETPANVIYVFHGWSGSAKGYSVSNLVEVDVPKSVNASFVLDYVDITVFIIITAAIIALSFGAFPVRFKIRGNALKGKERSS